MKSILVNIHGWEGYPNEGWRPWLKKELNKLGWEVKTPKMPDTNNPTLNKWVPYLNKIIKKPNKNLYFVGHSLAGITILRYLEDLKENIKIGGAIFVAGFSIEPNYKGYKNELSSFFQTPINWNKIKKHCDKFVVIQSTNDPYVSVEQANILKNKLNAKTILLNNMKHFSGDDGIFKLPVVLKTLLEISQ